MGKLFDRLTHKLEVRCRPYCAALVAAAMGISGACASYAVHVPVRSLALTSMKVRSSGALVWTKLFLRSCSWNAWVRVARCCARTMRMERISIRLSVCGSTHAAMCEADSVVSAFHAAGLTGMTGAVWADANGARPRKARARKQRHVTKDFMGIPIGLWRLGRRGGGNGGILGFVRMVLGFVRMVLGFVLGVFG